MIRTQIYLTNEEKQHLSVLARELESSQSELIRLAIDQFIEGKLHLRSDKKAALKAAKGLWSERDDLPDFDTLRDEFNDRDKK